MDSAKVLEPRLARFGLPGQTQAAVKLGSKWLMLEGTGVPQRNETDVQWLKSADPGSSVGGLARHACRTRVAAARRGSPSTSCRSTSRLAPLPAMTATLANWKQPRTAASIVSKPQWLRIGGDSLWVESIDLPDYPGALVAYVPSMRWVYSGIAASPLYFDLLVAPHSRARLGGRPHWFPPITHATDSGAYGITLGMVIPSRQATRRSFRADSRGIAIVRKERPLHRDA